MARYNKFTVECPSEDILLAFKEDNLSKEEKNLVSKHILTCEICLFDLQCLSEEATLQNETESGSTENLPDLIQEVIEKQRQIQSKTKQINPQFLLSVLKSEGLKAGQIWRTKNQDIIYPTKDGNETYSVTERNSIPHLVIIIDIPTENLVNNQSFQVVRIMPIDENTFYAREKDIVLSAAESPLGFEFLIQTWNAQNALAENLEAFLGELDVNFIESIKKLESEYSTYDFIKNGDYLDEKLRYRMAEFENTAYLREPVEFLHEITAVKEEKKEKKSFLEMIKSKFQNLESVFTYNLETNQSGFLFARGKEESDDEFITVGKFGSISVRRSIRDEFSLLLQSEDENLRNKFLLATLDNEGTKSYVFVLFFKNLLYNSFIAELRLYLGIQNLEFSDALISIEEVNTLDDETLKNIFQMSLSVVETQKSFDAWKNLLTSEKLELHVKDALRNCLKDFNRSFV